MSSNVYDKKCSLTVQDLDCCSVFVYRIVPSGSLVPLLFCSIYDTITRENKKVKAKYI